MRASWALTPGVLNPAVTQATIRCNRLQARLDSHGPAARRLHERPQDAKQLAQYGLRGPPSAFQEDHLISLELGGNPTDPRNLWPEPYPRAAEVDRIENELNARVCSGSLTLAEAQRRESALKHAAGLTAPAPRPTARAVICARSCVSRARSAAESAATAGAKAAEARAFRSRRGARPLAVSSSRTARRSSGSGRARDEAELVQRVDGAARRGSARADARGQVVEPQRAAGVGELDQRDPLCRRHRRAVVGAAGDAGELPQELAELLEDRSVGFGRSRITRNYCTTQ